MAAPNIQLNVSLFNLWGISNKRACRITTQLFKQCDLAVKVLHKLLPINNDTYNAFYMNYICCKKFKTQFECSSELQWETKKSYPCYCKARCCVKIHFCFVTDTFSTYLKIIGVFVKSASFWRIAIAGRVIRQS